MSLTFQQVARHSSFITLGFVWKKEESEKAGRANVYDVYGMGALELHDELATYAVFSAQVYEYVCDKADLEWPGVYEYDIDESFGMWICEHILNNAYGNPPDELTWKRKYLNFVASFFEGSRDAIFAELEAFFQVQPLILETNHV